MKLSSAEIKKILPHRYPLLIDRIEELEPGMKLCLWGKDRLFYQKL